MSFRIESHVGEALEKLKEKKAQALDMVGLAGEGFCVQHFTENAPYPYGTGDTRSSITHTVEGDSVKFGAGTDYAIYIEMGTGIHAGGRRTPWVFQAADGNWYRTQGMKPRPFVKPAATEHKEEYGKIIEQTFKG